MLVTDGGTSLTPEDAFALLGNEHRAEIIRTLGDAQGTEGPRATLAFSELYDEADADVGSGQFNYHLQKLVGAFVEQTDAGYRLRHEAVTLYRTILAGTYTERVSVDPFPVGVDCYHCGDPITAEYTDRRFSIECRGCDQQYSASTAPPSIVEDDRGAMLSRIDQYARRRILAFSKGVCAICANGLDTQMLPGETVDFSGSERLDVYVHRSCQHCGAQQYMSVGLSLLYDAALVAFFKNTGRDITETPIWELDFAMSDRYVDVHSRDPWRIEFTIERDGERFERTLDGEMHTLE